MYQMVEMAGSYDNALMNKQDTILRGKQRGAHGRSVKETSDVDGGRNGREVVVPEAIDSP